MDEIHREIIKGPIAICVSSTVFSLFSVYDHLYISTSHHLLSYDIKAREITSQSPPSPIISYLNYSDQCTRVLLGTENSLIWLHTKENRGQLTPATSVPVVPKQILMVNSVGTVVTLILYSNVGRSVVVKVNLRTMEVAKVCEVEQGVGKVTGFRGNLTGAGAGGVGKDAGSRVKVWRTGVGLEEMAAGGPEAVSGVFTIDDQYVILSSISLNSSSLYQFSLSKMTLKPGNRYQIKESSATLGLIANESRYYQICQKSVHIFTINSSKTVDFIGNFDCFAATSPVFTLFFTAFDQLLRLETDSKLAFAAEFPSAALSLVSIKNTLFVLTLQQNVLILQVNDGRIVTFVRNLQVSAAVSLSVYSEKVLIMTGNTVEIHDLGMDLKAVLRVNSGKMRVLTGKNGPFGVFLSSLSQAWVATEAANWSIEALIDSEVPCDLAQIGDNCYLAAYRNAVKIVKISAKTSENEVSGQIFGLNDCNLSVLSEKRVSIYAVFSSDFPSDTPGIPLSLPAAAVVTHLAVGGNSVLIGVKTGVDWLLQRHLIGKEPSLCETRGCEGEILTLESCMEGWIVCEQLRGYILTGNLLEFGPVVRFETEDYQKLRTIPDQETVQKLTDLDFVPKYEPLRNLVFLPPSSLPEQSSHRKAAIALTSTALYTLTWSKSLITPKSRTVTITQPLLSLSLPSFLSLSLAPTAFILLEEQTGKAWVGQIARLWSSPTLTNSLYTDPISYDLTLKEISLSQSITGVLAHQSALIALTDSGSVPVSVPQ